MIERIREAWRVLTRPRKMIRDARPVEVLRLPDIKERRMKTCPHCQERHQMSATFHECHTCGRKVCHGIGCFCTDHQANNPIRRGTGRADYSQGATKPFYPSATDEALAAYPYIRREPADD